MPCHRRPGDGGRNLFCRVHAIDEFLHGRSARAFDENNVAWLDQVGERGGGGEVVGKGYDALVAAGGDRGAVGYSARKPTHGDEKLRGGAADGTADADDKLQRVLTCDPGIGVARHADAGYPDAIAVAEREGVRIRANLTGGVEFDLGNSPREYTAQKVQGKTIVMTTTNGTRALRACAGAKAVLVIRTRLSARPAVEC